MRPLLRGWSHAAAVIVAVPAAAALVARSSGDLPRQVSLLAYGFSLISLFAVSALYHLWPWQASGRRAVRVLDHANIFIVIAGTYTPFCVNVLSGWLRATVLVVVWLLALLGVARSAVGVLLPRWAGAGLYLALGWAALPAAPALAQALPQSALALLATGGLLYTLGAIVYARQWPDPLPQIFGFHEVFHLLVIGASVAFFAVIWVWVLP